MNPKEEARKAMSGRESVLNSLYRLMKYELEGLFPQLRLEEKEQAEHFYNEIIEAFESKEWLYVIGTASEAAYFIKELRDYYNLIEDMMFAEYSSCPVCGEPFKEGHRCGKKWQVLLKLQAGDRSSFEIKTTEVVNLEEFSQLIGIVACKIGDEFELRFEVGRRRFSIFEWTKIQTTNFWIKPNEYEEELALLATKFGGIQLVFENGDHCGKYQLQSKGLFTGEITDLFGNTHMYDSVDAVFVCSRNFLRHTSAKVAYCCEPLCLLQWGHEKDVVIEVLPLDRAEKLWAIEKELEALRSDRERVRMETLLQAIEAYQV